MTDLLDILLYCIVYSNIILGTILFYYSYIGTYYNMYKYALK